MVGAAMRFGTGDAAGRKLFCTGAVGDMLLGGAGTGERFEGVQPGDEVAVDNREYLAYTYFHRYQVDANAPEYAQFRVDGRPLYPQRDKNFARSGLLSGGTPRGEFTGKMIVVQNAHDAACWPNAAISYRRAVERNLGDALGDHYRLWFNDHAAHLPASFNPVGRSAGAHDPSHRLRRVTRAGAPRPHGVGRGRHRATGRDRLHARRRPAAHARADRGRARRCAARRARRRRTAACAPTSRSASRSRSRWRPTRPPVAARSSASSGTSTAPARSRSLHDGVDGSQRVGAARDHARVRRARAPTSRRCASPRTATVTSTPRTAVW